MGTIQFTARDMARFGQLYLDEGLYRGKQILSSNWVKESLQAYSTKVTSGGVTSAKIGRYFSHIGYGYQWWSAQVGQHHFSYAAGHGGQLIILIDDLDLVIITTADPFFMQHDEEAWRYERAVYNLVGKFIETLPEL